MPPAGMVKPTSLSPWKSTALMWWAPSNWRNRFSIPITFGLPPDACTVLDAATCDPLYRKAIRVSAGAALITPFGRLANAADWLDLAAAMCARLQRDFPNSGFVDDALARGHEGVLVKALDAPYAAGRRGAARGSAT